MHQTEKSMICTILGRSVNELPYGMDEEYADCLALKTNLAYQIHNLYLDGVTNFLCTCEYGVPMWAAETVLMMRPYHQKMALHVIAPFEEQAARWSESVRDRYYSIHEQADTAKIMQCHFADESTSRRFTDQYLLEHSGIVLTDWDSLPSIDYARNKNLQVILLEQEFAYP